MSKIILVTGAGGYVGSLLTAELLRQGYKVLAFDTYWFGKNVLVEHLNLKIIIGDLRNYNFSEVLHEVNCVIHLACISNDPSYEIDPAFSKQINYEGSINLINSCIKANIERFIFASSSSVYGIKTEERVTENLTLNPLTPYSYYKIQIEEYLLKHVKNNFDLVILRPATLCGKSPRLRLDVIGNIFTSQAYFEKKLLIHGGSQFRPQLHIQDMVAAYIYFFKSEEKYKGEVFNLCERNYSLNEMSIVVGKVFGNDIDFEVVPVIDERSYRVDSEKLLKNTTFKINHTLEDAMNDLRMFFQQQENFSWKSENYHNVLKMKKVLNDKGIAD